MRKIAIAVSCIALAACSHIHVPLVSIPHFSKQPVVGVVEYDTGLTRFSTLTGIYHQEMCSKRDSDAHVHLSDKEMKSILSQADKSGFYRVPADLRMDWTDVVDKPAHCATFRLHIESGTMHNDVRWDCGRDGSNTPPVEVALLVLQIQKILQSKPEVQALPWSSCQVR